MEKTGYKGKNSLMTCKTLWATHYVLGQWTFEMELETFKNNDNQKGRIANIYLNSNSQQQNLELDVVVRR
jgi:hypothetical protein